MTTAFRERLDAIRRELDALNLASDVEAKVSPLIPQSSGAKTAWQCAVEIAALRDRRRAQSLDISVRALAREVGCSRGRAGELLKMHDELSGRVALFLGWGDREEGGRLLSRLSYRDLRAVLAIPAVYSMRRVSEIKGMFEQPKAHDTRSA